MTGVR
jgi:hypothetical protein